MKCPRCGAESADNTPLCPKCGTFLAEKEGPKPVKKPGINPVYIAAATLLAVILAAFIIRAAMSGGKSVTGADQPNLTGPSVTNAPPMPYGGPSVTNAPPPPVSSVPNPDNAIRPAPRQDIIEYLAFVGRIESARLAYLKDTTRALSMSTGAKGLENMIDWVMGDESKAVDPLADVKNELGTHVENWQRLVRQFDSVRPPAGCEEFAGSYRLALTTQTQEIYRISTILNSINLTNSESMQQALSQLQQMKSDPNTQGNIDKAVENADVKLAELCAREGIEKPFKVKKESEVGGSIIGGL